jgi:hypothetical protein
MLTIYMESSVGDDLRIVPPQEASPTVGDDLRIVPPQEASPTVGDDLRIVPDETSKIVPPDHPGQGAYADAPLPEVNAALDKLVMRGLLERERETQGSVTHYRLHDLAYSYARAQNSDENHHRALAACLTYTQRYRQPSLANFAALHPEVDNLLNAAGWALLAGAYGVVTVLADNLYSPDGRGGFLPLQGLSIQAVGLLEQAAQAFDQMGDKRGQGAALDSLGIAYADLGQYPKAIAY